MDEKIAFGQKLLEERKKAGKSQAEIAQLLGITTAAYQNYENGRREAGYATIGKLADFYGVTTDYLLGREPAPDPFGELRIDPNDEKAVLDRYMSFPPQTRAVLLDALRQLAGELESEGDAQLPIVEQTTVGAELDRLAADAAAEENAG